MYEHDGAHELMWIEVKFETPTCTARLSQMAEVWVNIYQ